MKKTVILLGVAALPFYAVHAQTAPAASTDTSAPAPSAVQTAAPAEPPATAPSQEVTTVPAPAGPVAATAVANSQGKIIMYRGSSIMGMGLACPIRYQGREIVELARGKYAEWVVNPGHYVLTNKTSSVDVSVDPGETRYVRCMIKPGFLVGRADLQIVDEASFNEHSKEFEKKPIE